MLRVVVMTALVCRLNMNVNVIITAVKKLNGSFCLSGKVCVVISCGALYLYTFVPCAKPYSLDKVYG